MDSQILISIILVFVFTIAFAVSIMSAAILFGTFYSLLFFVLSVANLMIVSQRIQYITNNR
jgi:hypothetical protein